MAGVVLFRTVCSVLFAAATKAAPIPTRRARAGLTLYVMVLLMVVTALVATLAQSVKETEIKAAFIYHFTSYVEWPPDAFSSSSSLFVIGVIGKSEIIPALRGAVRGKNWNERDFTIKRVEAAKEMRECQVLFVPKSEAKRLPQILDILGDAPVLTVGESEDFARKGGIINFYTEQNRVRFEINPEAAKRARLTISSKLLHLARIVRQ